MIRTDSYHMPLCTVSMKRTSMMLCKLSSISHHMFRCFWINIPIMSVCIRANTNAKRVMLRVYLRQLATLSKMTILLVLIAPDVRVFLSRIVLLSFRRSTLPFLISLPLSPCFHVLALQSFEWSIRAALWFAPRYSAFSSRCPKYHQTY